MYRLVELGGLDDILYRGGWDSGQRNGFGIQIFPNGYVYYGFWKANAAFGEGKLLYTDGTFYQGFYENNSIIKGVLHYWNGRKFEGEFYGGPNEFFKCGVFSFSDGDTFEGKWSQSGSCTEGTFYCKNAEVLKFEKHKKLIKYDDKERTLGKIIINDIIYEGGIKGTLRNEFGYIYSTFQHYNQSHFLKDCYNGFAIGNRISFGETCEGHIYNDKIVHIWKRTTVKGYEIIGDVKDNKYYVKFPFLNNDYFFGEITIDWTWNQNHHMTILKSGKYYQRCDGKDFQELALENVMNIYDVAEIRSRMYTFEQVMERLKTFYKIKNLFQLNEDLWEIIDRNGMPNINRVNIFDMDNEVFFKGTLLNGAKEGFCHVKYHSGDEYMGFFQNNKRHGKGKLVTDHKDIRLGSFANNALEGKVVIYDHDKGLFVADYDKGQIQKDLMMLFKDSELTFIGETKDMVFNGKGKLLYPKKFEIECTFSMGVIDDSTACLIKLDGEEPLQGKYLKITKKDNLAMFEVQDGRILMINLLQGKHCWPDL